MVFQHFIFFIKRHTIFYTLHSSRPFDYDASFCTNAGCLSEALQALSAYASYIVLLFGYSAGHSYS
jgi:hypothetical protein